MIRLTENDTGAVDRIEAGPHILDSGDRTEFESGAVRDMREGKGRCDLAPLDVAAVLLHTDILLMNVSDFQEDGNVAHLYGALHAFKKRWNIRSSTKYTDEEDLDAAACEMLLDVAKHFEEGAKKYGPSNWKMGIPAHVYIDSAVRHYLKLLAHWDDEPHDRAVAWNLMCCIWTCVHKPELNDYAKKEAN